jgi:oligoribonuclease
MSGLNPDEHVILEVAVIVTDDQLDIVAEGPNIAVYHSEDTLQSMEAWSRNHHSESGLLRRVQESTCDIKKAEQHLLDFLTQHVDKEVSPLCGNSVWHDRRFLRRYMPLINGYFHYRNIDVSSLKELVKRWYPDLPPFHKKKNHLALEDIKESIQELKYYHQSVFRP